MASNISWYYVLKGIIILVLILIVGWLIYHFFVDEDSRLFNLKWLTGEKPGSTNAKQSNNHITLIEVDPDSIINNNQVLPYATTDWVGSGKPRLKYTDTITLTFDKEVDPNSIDQIEILESKDAYYTTPDKQKHWNVLNYKNSFLARSSEELAKIEQILSDKSDIYTDRTFSYDGAINDRWTKSQTVEESKNSASKTSYSLSEVRDYLIGEADNGYILDVINSKKENGAWIIPFKRQDKVIIKDKTIEIRGFKQGSKFLWFNTGDYYYIIRLNKQLMSKPEEGETLGKPLNDEAAIIKFSVD
jgi:hypothetical protein